MSKTQTSNLEYRPKQERLTTWLDRLYYVGRSDSDGTFARPVFPHLKEDRLTNFSCASKGTFLSVVSLYLPLGEVTGWDRVHVEP